MALGQRYVVLVKGPHGRRWFRVDSAVGAYSFMLDRAYTLAAKYTDLRFTISALREDHERPIAPNKYRPWITS